MAKQFRVLDQLMMSLGDKEATYDAGPAAWTLGAAFQHFEFGEAVVGWDDKIVTDKDTVHGSQFATTSEIVRQDARLIYREPRVRPVHLAGLAALAGGVVAATQDGALTAYRHTCTPVAAAVALPSIGFQEKASGEQYKYTGVKLDTFALRRGGPERAYLEVEVGLIGSGTRAVAADSFPAKVTGGLPLRWGDVKCWLETGANISIDATPTQNAENISSATPDALTSRLLDFEFSHRNDLQADDGYAPGGGAVRTRLDHGPGRGATWKLVLIVDESTLATERAYYTAQDNVALEIECYSGTLIAAGGAMYYGLDLIIPRTRLAGFERGTQEGFNTLTLTGECMDDGTNAIWKLHVYNAQSAYLA